MDDQERRREDGLDGRDDAVSSSPSNSYSLFPSLQSDADNNSNNNNNNSNPNSQVSWLHQIQYQPHEQITEAAGESAANLNNNNSSSSTGNTSTASSIQNNVLVRSTVVIPAFVIKALIAEFKEQAKKRIDKLVSVVSSYNILELQLLELYNLDSFIHHSFSQKRAPQGLGLSFSAFPLL